MEKLNELKAKFYDLIVQKQAVELEMQRLNQAILNLQKEDKQKKSKNEAT